MYGRAPEEDLLSRQREATAVEMRLQGYEFEEIAAKCGYNDRSAAHKAWKRALKRVSQPVAQEARSIMQMRLNSYRRAMATQKYGEYTARMVEVLIKVEEREAKLFGLDVTDDATLSTPPQIVIGDAMVKAITGATATYAEGSEHGSASAS